MPNDSKVLVPYNVLNTSSDQVTPLLYAGSGLTSIETNRAAKFIKEAGKPSRESLTGPSSSGRLKTQGSRDFNSQRTDGSAQDDDDIGSPGKLRRHYNIVLPESKIPEELKKFDEDAKKEQAIAFIHQGFNKSEVVIDDEKLQKLEKTIHQLKQVNTPRGMSDLIQDAEQILRLVKSGVAGYLAGGQDASWAHVVIGMSGEDKASFVKRLETTIDSVEMGLRYMALHGSDNNEALSALFQSENPINILEHIDDLEKAKEKAEDYAKVRAWQTYFNGKGQTFPDEFYDIFNRAAKMLKQVSQEAVQKFENIDVADVSQKVGELNKVITDIKLGEKEGKELQIPKTMLEAAEKFALDVERESQSIIKTSRGQDGISAAKKMQRRINVGIDGVRLSLEAMTALDKLGRQVKSDEIQDTDVINALKPAESKWLKSIRSHEMQAAGVIDTLNEMESVLNAQAYTHKTLAKVGLKEWWEVPRKEFRNKAHEMDRVVFKMLATSRLAIDVKKNEYGQGDKPTSKTSLVDDVKEKKKEYVTNIERFFNEKSAQAWQFGQALSLPFRKLESQPKEGLVHLADKIALTSEQRDDVQYRDHKVNSIARSVYWLYQQPALRVQYDFIPLLTTAQELKKAHPNEIAYYKDEYAKRLREAVNAVDYILVAINQFPLALETIIETHAFSLSDTDLSKLQNKIGELSELEVERLKIKHRLEVISALSSKGGSNKEADLEEVIHHTRKIARLGDELIKKVGNLSERETGKRLDPFSRRARVAKDWGMLAYKCAPESEVPTAESLRNHLKDNEMLEGVVPANDPDGILFATRMHQEWLDAKGDKTIMPLSPEEYANQEKSFAEFIVKWGQSQVTRGAISATVNTGLDITSGLIVTLVKGSVKAGIKIAIASVKIPYKVHKAKQGLMPGEPYPLAAVSYVINQQMKKLGFKIAMGFVPRAVKVAAGGLTYLGAFSHNHYQSHFGQDDKKIKTRSWLESVMTELATTAIVAPTSLGAKTFIAKPIVEGIKDRKELAHIQSQLPSIRKDFLDYVGKVEDEYEEMFNTWKETFKKDNEGKLDDNLIEEILAQADRDFPEIKEAYLLNVRRQLSKDFDNQMKLLIAKGYPLEYESLLGEEQLKESADLEEEVLTPSQAYPYIRIDGDEAFAESTMEILKGLQSTPSGREILERMNLYGVVIRQRITNEESGQPLIDPASRTLYFNPNDNTVGAPGAFSGQGAAEVRFTRGALRFLNDTDNQEPYFNDKMVENENRFRAEYSRQNPGVDVGQILYVQEPGVEYSLPYEEVENEDETVIKKPIGGSYLGIEIEGTRTFFEATIQHFKTLQETEVGRQLLDRMRNNRIVVRYAGERGDKNLVREEGGRQFYVSSADVVENTIYFDPWNLLAASSPNELADRPFLYRDPSIALFHELRHIETHNNPVTITAHGRTIILGSDGEIEGNDDARKEMREMTEHLVSGVDFTDKNGKRWRFSNPVWMTRYAQTENGRSTNDYRRGFYKRRKEPVDLRTEYRGGAEHSDGDFGEVGFGWDREFHASRNRWIEKVKDILREQGVLGDGLALEELAYISPNYTSPEAQAEVIRQFRENGTGELAEFWDVYSEDIDFEFHDAIRNVPLPDGRIVEARYISEFIRQAGGVKAFARLAGLPEENLTPDKIRSIARAAAYTRYYTSLNASNKEGYYRAAIIDTLLQVENGNSLSPEQRRLVKDFRAGMIGAVPISIDGKEASNAFLIPLHPGERKGILINLLAIPPQPLYTVVNTAADIPDSIVGNFNPSDREDVADKLRKIKDRNWTSLNFEHFLPDGADEDEEPEGRGLMPISIYKMPRELVTRTDKSLKLSGNLTETILPVIAKIRDQDADDESTAQLSASLLILATKIRDALQNNDEQTAEELCRNIYSLVKKRVDKFVQYNTLQEAESLFLNSDPGMRKLNALALHYLYSGQFTSSNPIRQFVHDFTPDGFLRRSFPRPVKFSGYHPEPWFEKLSNDDKYQPRHNWKSGHKDLEGFKTALAGKGYTGEFNEYYFDEVYVKLDTEAVYYPKGNEPFAVSSSEVSRTDNRIYVYRGVSGKDILYSAATGQLVEEPYDDQGNPNAEIDIDLHMPTGRPDRVSSHFALSRDERVVHEEHMEVKGHVTAAKLLLPRKKIITGLEVIKGKRNDVVFPFSNSRHRGMAHYTHFDAAKYYHEYREKKLGLPHQSYGRTDNGGSLSGASTWSVDKGYAYESLVSLYDARLQDIPYMPIHADSDGVRNTVRGWLKEFVKGEKMAQIGTPFSPGNTNTLFIPLSRGDSSEYSGVMVNLVTGFVIPIPRNPVKLAELFSSDAFRIHFRDGVPGSEYEQARIDLTTPPKREVFERGGVGQNGMGHQYTVHISVHSLVHSIDDVEKDILYLSRMNEEDWNNRYFPLVQQSVQRYFQLIALGLIRPKASEVRKVLSVYKLAVENLAPRGTSSEIVPFGLSTDKLTRDRMAPVLLKASVSKFDDEFDYSTTSHAEARMKEFLADASVSMRFIGYGLGVGLGMMFPGVGPGIIAGVVSTFLTSTSLSLVELGVTDSVEARNTLISGILQEMALAPIQEVGGVGLGKMFGGPFAKLGSALRKAFTQEAGEEALNKVSKEGFQKVISAFKSGFKNMVDNVPFSDWVRQTAVLMMASETMLAIEKAIDDDELTGHLLWQLLNQVIVLGITSGVEGAALRQGTIPSRWEAAVTSQDPNALSTLVRESAEAMGMPTDTVNTLIEKIKSEGLSIKDMPGKSEISETLRQVSDPTNLETETIHGPNNKSYEIPVPGAYDKGRVKALIDFFEKSKLGDYPEFRLFRDLLNRGMKPQDVIKRAHQIKPDLVDADILKQNLWLIENGVDNGWGSSRPPLGVEGNSPVPGTTGRSLYGQAVPFRRPALDGGEWTGQSGTLPGTDADYFAYIKAGGTPEGYYATLKEAEPAVTQSLFSFFGKQYQGRVQDGQFEVKKVGSDEWRAGHWWEEFTWRFKNRGGRVQSSAELDKRILKAAAKDPVFNFLCNLSAINTAQASGELPKGVATSLQSTKFNSPAYKQAFSLPASVTESSSTSLVEGPLSKDNITESGFIHTGVKDADGNVHYEHVIYAYVQDGKVTLYQSNSDTFYKAFGGDMQQPSNNRVGQSSLTKIEWSEQTDTKLAEEQGRRPNLVYSFTPTNQVKNVADISVQQNGDVEVNAGEQKEVFSVGNNAQEIARIPFMNEGRRVEVRGYTSEFQGKTGQEALSIHGDRQGNFYLARQSHPMNAQQLVDYLKSQGVDLKSGSGPVHLLSCYSKSSGAAQALADVINRPVIGYSNRGIQLPTLQQLTTNPVEIGSEMGKFDPRRFLAQSDFKPATSRVYYPRSDSSQGASTSGRASLEKAGSGSGSNAKQIAFNALPQMQASPSWYSADNIYTPKTSAHGVIFKDPGNPDRLIKFYKRPSDKGIAENNRDVMNKLYGQDAELITLTGSDGQSYYAVNMPKMKGVSIEDIKDPQVMQDMLDKIEAGDFIAQWVGKLQDNGIRVEDLNLGSVLYDPSTGRFSLVDFDSSTISGSVSNAHYKQMYRSLHTPIRDVLIRQAKTLFAGQQDKLDLVNRVEGKLSQRFRHLMELDERGEASFSTRMEERTPADVEVAVGARNQEAASAGHADEPIQLSKGDWDSIPNKVEMFGADSEFFYEDFDGQIYKYDAGDGEITYLVKQDGEYINLKNDQTWQPRRYSVVGPNAIKTWLTGDPATLYADTDKVIADRSASYDNERLENIRNGFNQGHYLPPIDVRWDNGVFKVINGNHRLKVAREMGMESIPYRLIS
ncbi:ParB/RepB/Spo0J family partition protein [Vibrio hepatarius]|uniref:ParB/RepB/Spo0J family partition protein n=1 Tax=Vibrio hepatarius TaxID=171383 RepID=UPI001C09B418|nr:ParB/RepB/Spo0J family partition protein [Vibrio hepatarius]MBU2897826.1 ParB/RepB/Spo0J family partition protein [Vibrio hepatarius]